MAIAVDNVQSVSSGANSTTLTLSGFAVGSGSNRLLLVGVSMNNRVGGPTTVNSVTFGGTGLTSQGKRVQGDDAYSEIWSLLAPANSTADIVVTLDANDSCAVIVCAMSFSGVHQSATFGTLVSNSATTGTAISVVAVSATNELVFDVVAYENPAPTDTLTVGAGQTQRWNIYQSGGSDSRDATGCGSTEPGSVATTMSWTSSNNGDWAICAIPIKPAAAGAVVGSVAIGKNHPKINCLIRR